MLKSSMGTVNIKVIPAAILYSNPGINRDEFVVLLNQIRYSCKSNYGVADLDDPHHLELGSYGFHGGIFELARILCLECDLEEIPFVYPNVLDALNERPEENALGKLYVEPRSENDMWLTPRYFLQVGIKERHLGEEINKRSAFFEQPAVGNIYSDFRKKHYRIRKVHSVRHSVVDGNDKFTAVTDSEIFDYLPVIEQFESIDALVAKHPDYNPDVCINWNKPESFFIAPNFRFDKNIRWRQKNGKYYLLQDCLSEENYSDIVITAEAIRKKKWGLFQFHGYCLTQKFLVENEDSDYAHQKAILDYWLSRYGKLNNMTNTELLRYRLETGIGNIKYQRLSDADALHIVCAEARQPHGLLTDLYVPTTLEVILGRDSVDDLDKMPF